MWRSNLLHYLVQWISFSDRDIVWFVFRMVAKHLEKELCCYAFINRVQAIDKWRLEKFAIVGKHQPTHCSHRSVTFCCLASSLDFRNSFIVWSFATHNKGFTVNVLKRMSTMDLRWLLVTFYTSIQRCRRLNLEDLSNKYGNESAAVTVQLVFRIISYLVNRTLIRNAIQRYHRNRKNRHCLHRFAPTLHREF